MDFSRWKHHRAAKRIRAGDGEALPRFRWWQMLSRSLLTLTLKTAEGAPASYAVDVRHLGDADDGVARARLYRNDKLLSLSTLPARFPLPGGNLEVDIGTYGMRRCHFVADNGAVIQMVPHPATAEGRRAGLHRRHPMLSRVIGVTATAVVLLAVVVTVPQLIETLSRIPPVAEEFGVIEAPIKLSLAANVALGVAAVVASTERALRLRTSWLDTLAGS